MENKRYRWHVIHDHIKNIENPIGAEIGVHRGECSGHLLELHPGLKLYMIDMWSPDTYKGKGDDAATGPYRELYQNQADENFMTARNNVEKYGDRAKICLMSSLEASKYNFDSSFDFIFIDGAHDYDSVKADILAWIKKIKPGGYLFCHDYGLFDGVARAVNEIFPSNAKYLNWPEIDSDYMAVIKL